MLSRVFTFLATALTLAAAPLERWVYAPVNHLVPAEIDRLEALMAKAKPLGYTHFLLADSKFSRLAEMDRRYFDHIDRVKQTAGRLGLQLVPAVFPVGYSNDILGQDPNLAEGLPVKDALFVVKGGEARLVPESPVTLPSFADRRAWKFVDRSFEADGAALRSRDGKGGNARAMMQLKLLPFRHYHVSVRVKTQDFHGTPEVKALVERSHSLIYTALGAKPTQDWTTHHVTFNTLDHTDVNLYFGVWGAGAGTLWMEAPVLEEAGPVNVLRREGCPFTVKADDGRLLTEGTDYERFTDPRLGNQPYGGEYEVWHEAPPLRTKNLPDGTKLRVSWFHPHVVHDGQVCACVSEPAFMKLLATQAADMHKTWQAPGYMMSHDEWRVLGWDDACLRRKLTPGQIVSDNVKQCTALLARTAPQARVFTWSDMFDPFHNAVKDYYLVNGDLAGAWEGLPKDVVVMNWNFGKRAESLKFFADRENKQIIAGYYDDDPAQLAQWLSATEGVSGVIGVMYTTWRQNYADLAAFAKVIDAHEKKR